MAQAAALDRLENNIGPKPTLKHRKRQSQNPLLQLTFLK
jgi:hypothetical protein